MRKWNDSRGVENNERDKLLVNWGSAADSNGRDTSNRKGGDDAAVGGTHFDENTSVQDENDKECVEDFAYDTIHNERACNNLSPSVDRNS